MGAISSIAGAISSIAGAISSIAVLIAIRLLPDSAIAPSTKGSYLVAIVRGSAGAPKVLDTFSDTTWAAGVKGDDDLTSL